MLFAYAIQQSILIVILGKNNMLKIKTIGAALLAAGVFASASAQAEVIYSSFNDMGVDNNPFVDTLFSLGTSKTITSIYNYHFNFFRGADPTNGWIGIEQRIGSSWVNVGQWSVIGSVGYAGTQNANWTAAPNITLGAGDYRVIDSDPATWSWSGGSGGYNGPDWVAGRGFSEIQAVDAAQQAVSEPMSMALFGLGLAGLALTRRRQAVQSA